MKQIYQRCLYFINSPGRTNRRAKKTVIIDFSLLIKWTNNQIILINYVALIYKRLAVPQTFQRQTLIYFAPSSVFSHKQYLAASLFSKPVLCTFCYVRHHFQLRLLLIVFHGRISSLLWKLQTPFMSRCISAFNMRQNSLLHWNLL